MSSKGYDVLVLGGGSAGCVLASRLSEDPDRSVCMVEAGPDYGPYADGRWPADLLNAHELAVSHDWGIEGGWSSWRARVLGGCSAHNGCFIVWGLPADYDEWGEAGNAGWSHAGLQPHRRRGEQALRVRSSRIDDLEPIKRAGLDAAAELGLPLLDDFDDPLVAEGAGPLLVNAVGDVRWNAAFAYLDPARGRPNLTIMADALVDRVRLEAGRALGAIVRHRGRELEVSADLVVLSAGAYGSPAVLLRSGIGAHEDLIALSIPVNADLRGVGRGLKDHPGIDFWFRPSSGLLEATQAHFAARPDTAVALIRARSGSIDREGWDLHVFVGLDEPSPDDPVDAAGELATLFACQMKPASEGRVRIRSSDPGALPIVEHGFLTDPEGHDVGALADGMRLARRLARTRAMSSLCDIELAPGPDVVGRELEDYARARVGGYWHPVGTCKMGPDADPNAVVDAAGRVRGFRNLYVVDASIMPTIPRANTHLPVIAIAERMAQSLAGP